MRLTRRLRATLALVASAATTHAVRSQEPDQSSFYLLLRGDTIFDERATRTVGRLTGEFRDRLRNVRVTYDATLNNLALVTHVDLRTYRSVGDTAGDPASFTFDGDSIVAKIGAGGPAKIPSIAGALAIVNPSVGFIEQIVMRARAIGTDPASVMIFVIGGPQPFAGTVHRLDADSVRVQYASVMMDLAVSPTGRVLGGVIPAQGIRIARGPALGSLRVERPDYAAPANAPYLAEDIVVTTPAGLHLAGTLTIPRAPLRQSAGDHHHHGLRAGGSRRAIGSDSGLSPLPRAGRHAGPARHRGTSAGRSRRRWFGCRLRQIRPAPISPTTFGPASRTSAAVLRSTRAASASWGTARGESSRR